jgi:hypothetical protein
VGVVYCHGQHIEPDELRAFLLARVERHLVPDRIVASRNSPPVRRGKAVAPNCVNALNVMLHEPAAQGLVRRVFGIESLPIRFRPTCSRSRKPHS